VLRQSRALKKRGGVLVEAAMEEPST